MTTLETYAPPVSQIVTGHFHEKSPYATWRSKGTDDWLLILTIAGGGRFGYSGGEFEAGARHAVLIKPRTLHDYGISSAHKQWELIWAHFHPRSHWHGLLDLPEAAPGLMGVAIGHSETSRLIIDALTDMHAANTGAHRRREMLAMNALERALLYLDTLNSRAPDGRIDDRVQLAMEILLGSLHMRFSLQPAADACGLSTSRLAHLFAQQTGVTPQRYVERERLSRATQELALTDRPVNVIASSLGFESPFYFSRRFKLFAGISPRQYRIDRR